MLNYIYYMNYIEYSSLIAHNNLLITDNEYGTTEEKTLQKRRVGRDTWETEHCSPRTKALERHQAEDKQSDVRLLGETPDETD